MSLALRARVRINPPDIRRTEIVTGLLDACPGADKTSFFPP